MNWDCECEGTILIIGSNLFGVFFIADNNQTRFAARENGFIVRTLNEGGENHYHRKFRSFYKVVPEIHKLG
jgi:hypothetical protein